MTRRICQSTFVFTLTVMSCVTGLACVAHVELVSTVAQASGARYVGQTRADAFHAHVAFLAHDELEGRGTGSNGIDLAAGYIAGQFAAAGLKPGGPSGTFFQEFDVAKPAKLLRDTSLAVDGSDAALALHDDFRPMGFSANGEFSANVVFIGYGIVNSDKAHDDYAGVETAGRVALMLRREPTSWNDGGGFTDHARFDSKIKLAKENGAVAVLIANQDPGEDGIDGLMRFRSRGEDYGLPVMHVKRRVADLLLTAGGLASLSDLQEQLDGGGKNSSSALAGVRVNGRVAYESNDMLARNVIGVLEGNGPYADEYIVIGGHYDHLGKRRGQIYNGADDNASGTAAVIELAYALADTPRRDRSVIFMAFSGEEIGLLGSEHYANDPTVDIESIVAMINMDMIGRLTPDDQANMLSIQGLGTGDSFKEIVERRADQAGLDYTPDDSALGPSDHVSFYHAGVPSLFFFTGVHSDYHQPGDDTEKVNIEGAARIINLVYNIAADIINGEASPTYAEVTTRANIFRGGNPMAPGVVMGIMPDMDDDSDAPGWRVAMVAPGGGAAKAGMKVGDRILKVNAVVINGFMDYREATRGKKPGDVIDVIVKRGQEQITLNVKLSARGG